MNAMFLLMALSASAVSDGSPTVGCEGAISVVLASASLQPVPVDARAPLVVRIAKREAVAEGTRYDLRWLGAVPGTYDLTRFLVDVDGHPLSGAAAILVTVASVLPAGYPGDLQQAALPPPARLGGYQRLMIALGVLWLAALPFLWRRKRRARAVVPAAPPSLAEQLRPLIERARSGGLTTDEQARLERLLLAHWRARLDLQDVDAPLAMRRLREHAEAGVLLRHLDTWLHAPPGRGAVDVQALLAPYRAQPEVRP